MAELNDWLGTALQDLPAGEQREWPAPEELQRRGSRHRQRRLIAASGGTSLLLALGLVIGLVASSSTSPPSNPRGTTAIRYLPAGDGALQLVADVSRANPNASPQEVARLAAAEETFGIDLMRLQLAASPDTNVLLSPLSAHLDLSMLELGAAGPTTQQIATALQTAGLSADAQAQAWNSLSQELLAAESSGELHLANSLWVARGLHVEAGFVEAAARSFGDDTYQTNFRTAAATDAINAWIARETGGRIQRLLQPGQLAPYTEV
ncbi:MAG: serpin family protein, partial [Acidimicrobiales bacterium]